ncbi:MAG TPA: MFS transporter [Acidimicrobiales bacterium]|jgi:EmrB/QacA subfamily drug resistance transporter
MTGTFMIVLDFFIVNVALPSMQSKLHASASALEWVVAGYGLTFSTLLITAGRLGDQIGRRRVFAIGLALFVVTSAACGVAPNADLLVAARILQGVAGALISPTVLSIVGVVFNGPDRVRAISIYGATLGLAAAGGQLIGGLLIQANPAGLGWRSVFLINVPVGVAALAFTRRWVPESRAEASHRLDLVGTALLTAGLTAVVLPLVEGRQLGWPAWTWMSLAAAPIILAAFAAHQHRLSGSGGAPLLDTALFRDKTLTAGLITQLGLWCGQASFFLVFALYLQPGRGLSALHAGLVFTILAGAYVVASVPAPALTLRFGRTLIGAGALTLAAGHLLLLAAVSADGVGGSIGALVPGLLLVGAGMGLCITPLTTTVLASADPQRAGMVSGALSTMQQVGNSIGVAIMGVIFFGAVGHGYGHAFSLCVATLGGLLLGVALLSRLLPAPAPTPALTPVPQEA